MRWQGSEIQKCRNTEYKKGYKLRLQGSKIQKYRITRKTLQIEMARIRNTRNTEIQEMLQIKMARIRAYKRKFLHKRFLDGNCSEIYAFAANSSHFAKDWWHRAAFCHFSPLFQIDEIKRFELMAVCRERAVCRKIMNFSCDVPRRAGQPGPPLHRQLDWPPIILHH